MNTRSPLDRPSRRPSTTSHISGRSRAVSASSTAFDPHAPYTHSHGTSGPGTAASSEEISEIKRYGDFRTIDWVQDAVHEQARRRRAARRTAEGGFVGGSSGSERGFWEKEGTFGWRRKAVELYDAGQAWLVVTLVGAAIGVNSALLNIITEWLADVKLGHCKTAFYLNQAFCCWGGEEECAEWTRWTPSVVLNYFVYFFFAVLFAFFSAVLVNSFAPYAAGSGISEIKVIIAGFVMRGFLGLWTLTIKSIGLPLAIASGLSIGKEGPSVHFAVCTGNVISRCFGKYRRNAAKTREILTAAAASGVAVAFGSPIGGVLFSLEEMTSYFPLKTLWRSYFCALVATGVLSLINPFRTGQLVMFQVKYDRTWHFFELFFFALLGIFGGLYGAFVIKWNLYVQAFRKKHLRNHPVLEATILAGLTALVCYPNMFLRINMTDLMEILFLECEDDHDYAGICRPENRWSMVASLAIATVLRILLVIVSYGCKVPAGIFVPSMAVGASFGRMVGILVQALHEQFPDSVFFSSCQPDVPCITPGTYAFLGAGAALSGIMHLTISVTVIMFELTGALTYILPTMIVVGITKAVNSLFPKGGIADRMIWFNGFPYLDDKEEHLLDAPIANAMTKASALTVLSARGMSVAQVQQLLATTKFQGFPVVDPEPMDPDDIDDGGGVRRGDVGRTTTTTRPTLVGFMGRTELQYAIDRACHGTSPALASSTTLRFLSLELTDAGHDVGTGTSNTIPRGLNQALNDTASVQGAPDNSNSALFVPEELDASPYVDLAPLTVHPRLPFETVVEMFRKLGPRVIVVERHGQLVGLVTAKDCLKFQFQVERLENGHSGSGDAGSSGVTNGGESEEWPLRVPIWLTTALDWARSRVSGWFPGFPCGPGTRGRANSIHLPPTPPPERGSPVTRTQAGGGGGGSGGGSSLSRQSLQAREPQHVGKQQSMELAERG